MKKRLLFFFLWVLLGVGLHAQEIIRQRLDFSWQQCPFETRSAYLYFPEATYNEELYGRLPLFSRLYSVDVPGKSATVSLSNPVFIPVNEAYPLSEKEKAMLSDTLFYQTASLPEHRKSNLSFTLLPFRYNPETGLPEQLYCVDVAVSFSGMETVKKQYAFHARSPLATGDWYKIGLSETGIYKITGADLKKMGMDISAINPENLKVYGKGGGMLPEINGENPNTGIEELAIFVSQNEGAFGEDDYILFYGESPHAWHFETASMRFRHFYNIYSERNYYYVSVEGGAGKRIASVNNSHLVETRTTNQSDFYLFQEEDIYNKAETGKVWLGEKYTPSASKSFTIEIPDVVTSESAFLRVAAAAKKKNQMASFLFNIADLQDASLQFTQTEDDVYYNSSSFYYNPTSSTNTLKITFNGESVAEGWLDYFEIQARRNLVYHDKPMGFRDKRGINDSITVITKFILAQATSAVTVWDVTDVYNICKMETAAESNGRSFKRETQDFREFIAFGNTGLHTPELIGKVKNQNLLGLRDVESVIVTYSEFYGEAQKIADDHKNNLGLTTVLLTPADIYAEFSSGRPDISAIRDFMRMLYLTADSKPPRSLLLFGNGTNDYKNKASLSCFVPTWTSANSRSGGLKQFVIEKEEVCDDFFVLLETGAGGTDTDLRGLPNLGVGRFPLRSISDAEVAVKKRLHYTSKSPKTMGSWRNVVSLVADDPDAGTKQNTYAESCEGHATVIASVCSDMVVDKIYSASYPLVVAAGGARRPAVNNAINTRIAHGALILNYIGHGSPESWADERILEVGDINSWKNYDKLPFIITEACTYAPFHRPAPQTISGGEIMFLHPNGGAIALMTSVKSTYNGDNNKLSRGFYKAILPSDANNYESITIGEAVMMAKRNMSEYGNMERNSRWYVLLGDPALKLAFPRQNVVCTEVNENDVLVTLDTLRALSSVVMSGEVRDINGNLLSGFNGKVYPTVYDKELTLRTIAKHPSGEDVLDYKMWQNVIFRGNGTVKDGKFSFEFFVPKDIDYTYDFSRASFYAYDENTMEDASGTFHEFVVGGIAPGFEDDSTCPELQLFMNDTLFISGGYTDCNPVLLAVLADKNGINATGSSIGHDVMAILDGDVNKQITLNTYYEATEGYWKGRVQYPFYDLPEGEHTITVRAWDTYNNSVAETIKFVVVSGSQFIIENLYNYPNPFSDATSFTFEHNGAEETLDIQIRIFDLAGRMVKEIKQKSYASGYRIPPIVWYGDVDGGGQVANGYYVYQALVKTSTGAKVRKSGKLIVSR